MRYFLPIALTAAAAGFAGCGTDGGAGALRVLSSISNGAALSDSLEWTARPLAVASGDRVDHVEFVIDGRVRWTDHRRPYFFDGDHHLHPWTIGVGRHTLAVRVVTTNRQRASTSSQVVVSPRTASPDALVGTFARRQPGGEPWRVRFTRSGLAFFDDPAGERGIEAVTAADDGSLLFHGAVDWMVPTKRRRTLCAPLAGTGVYHWRVRGHALTLVARSDRCAARKAIFNGAWAAQMSDIREPNPKG